ncbi:rod shape-determining protein MreC [Patescibacteria group bacterium]|nr:rod shape-determining protein MreC [Patescibacteria group bacterium]
MSILQRKWTLKYKRSIRITWAVLGIFIAVVILAQFTFFIRLLQAIQFRLVALATSTSQIWEGTYKTNDSAIQETEYYKSLLSEAAVDSSRIYTLEEEISELQEYLFYVPENGYSKILAKTILRSVDGTYKILIDKGLEDGIKDGMGVVVDRGIFVGYIEKAERNSATVTLVSNKTSKIPATILGTNYTTGIIEGQGGFLLKMNYIPQEELIRVGDTIVTSGLGGLYPSGLVIGVVSQVIKNESEPFQQAMVEPMENARDYMYLNVLSVKEVL